jgi:membrane-associated phospholipid phosphatase
MDVWLLKLFNHWVARSPEAFYKALSLSNHPSWLLATCTIVSLWFVGKSELGKPETDSIKSRKLIRLESRRRVVVLFIALVISFVLTRVVASIFDRPRPLVNALLEIPIDPTVWKDVKGALSMQGAFPSDHAAMFAVVTVSVFSINRWAGWMALVVSLYFSALRIGIGFHWPSDMFVGALIGVLITLLLLGIKPRLHRVLDPLLLHFERFPTVAYPIAFLVLLDLSQKFSGLFGFLSLILGQPVGH